MSNLLVVTFPKQETASEAGARIKDVQKAGGASLKDMAVVEKDAEGKVHVQHGIDTATAGGAIGGGVLGLLIGLVFFPVAGLVIGAALGAFIGRSLHHNVDKKLVEDVTADLTEDTSALFVVGEGSPAALIGALKPFKGKVYQTSIDAELEREVTDALRREG